MEYNSTNQQENKNLAEDESVSLLTQTLSDFKKINNNADYLKLVSQLIAFKQLKKDQINLKTEIAFDNIKTKLYQNLEELLTEAVLINNPKVRNEQLRKQNHWFNYTLKYFESLVRIKEKTTKSNDQLIDPEPPILDEELPFEEIRKHRCDIEGFEAPNIRLKEFSRKEVSVPLYIRQMNMTEASSFRKTGDKCWRMNSGKSSNIKTTCYATQTESKFFKPNSYIANNTDDQRIINANSTLSTIWFNPSKEVKSSYSYMRPEYKYPHLVLEKEIKDTKMKIIADKRHTDEVYDSLQEFSTKRADFTQKLNKKHEIKDLIKKYRVIVELNAKKEEEERIRLAKEKQLKDMIDKENERKRIKEQEEQKKKEEEEANQKNNANNYYPKATTLSNETEEEKLNEKEKQSSQNKSEDEGEDEQEESEAEEIEDQNEEGEEEESKPQEVEIKEKLKDKVNTYYIKHISPLSSSPNEKIINIQCKISRETIRIKNNNEMLQRKITDRENALLEMNQQIQISLPSDLISYTTTSNKVLSLRTFNSKMLNIKQIDTPKDTYQKSLRPLSLYDQVHMIKTEPTQKTQFNSDTFKFLYNSYLKNSNDFLNFRHTLSSFRENSYNVIKNNGSKQMKNIKIIMKNSFCNPLKVRSNTPLTYLPNPSNALLHLP